MRVAGKEAFSTVNVKCYWEVKENGDLEMPIRKEEKVITDLSKSSFGEAEHVRAILELSNEW